MANLVGVAPGLLSTYSCSPSSRTARYHRAQIRELFGTREASEDDQDRWARWLAEEVCPVESKPARLEAALRERCLTERIEAPAAGQVERVVASAVRRFEEAFAAETARRLGPSACARLEQRYQEEGWLAGVKTDPGRLSLDTLLVEIGKLAGVRGIGIGDEVFAGVSAHLLGAYRARAARMFPSDFAACTAPVRYTLLAALCFTRQSEITDALVQLMIDLIHKINARAERRVEKEMIDGLSQVPGKASIFRKLVTAAVGRPDGLVRDVLYPVVPGGEKTLRALAKELMATEKVWQEKIRYTLRGSYTHHYRRMLAPILSALAFGCNNTAWRPLMDAVGLLARYKDTDASQKYYAPEEQVPIEGVVPKVWMEAVRHSEPGQIERVPYELCVLIALKDALRRREIFVEGAGRWRDIDEDLPGEFEDNRDVHYAALRKPLDAATFTADLRRRMTDALDTLETGLTAGTAGGVRITKQGGRPWIAVPKLEKLPEPTNLGALKAEIARRWGTLDLLDVLKDTAILTGFTDQFVTVATREALSREVVQRRLLLSLFALGTNMGIKRMAATGDHQEDEGALRRIRASHITRENLRAAITSVVNATLAVRDPAWWGRATSTASDSKRFGSWESNAMTQFHARYAGYGVMIYWHVERGRVCIYSQLKNCSSSEVASMIEGVLRHGTDAQIEENYTDTHGASEIGFAFTELLGFKLLPRLKNIGAMSLYIPEAGPTNWPSLAPVTKAHPIDWDLIEKNYDLMMKYATALRLGTADAEQILARFKRGSGPKHPYTWRSPSSDGPCAQSSCASTWPARICAVRSTRAFRSWRTGTVATKSSSTARTECSLARTARASRSRCWPCIYSRPASTTSTRSWSRRCSPTNAGGPGSPTRTAAPCPRCSGRTSTLTAASNST